jgi:hypothetical protein
MEQHQEAPAVELLVRAISQLTLPLHQDVSRRGTHATPPRGRFLECFHPRAHRDQANVGWRPVSASEGVQLQLRDCVLIKVSARTIHMMEDVMECLPRTMLLHLRIAAWHDDRTQMGHHVQLDVGELKTILRVMPRQELLERMDPSGELLVPVLRAQLNPLMRQYERLIIQDLVDNDTWLKDALKIYNFLHQLTRAPDWGEIALSCTCGMQVLREGLRL